jgi:hypothetical protein
MPDCVHEALRIEGRRLIAARVIFDRAGSIVQRDNQILKSA